jgi:hypothetical protein
MSTMNATPPTIRYLANSNANFLKDESGILSTTPSLLYLFSMIGVIIHLGTICIS